MSAVTVTRATGVPPTYHPLPPDSNPIFLEKRVHQGGSGKVYPLPFTDRIASERVDHARDAIHLENERLRIMILPQIGGRIHLGQEKTNGHDFFHRQVVIKSSPADIADTNQIHLTGLHLDQYRHATRSLEPYWHEDLRRDPGDSRCHLALGRPVEADAQLPATLALAPLDCPPPRHLASTLAARASRINYFATSLPTMLLFEENLDTRQKPTALVLEAQARAGLGGKKRARLLLAEVLRRVPAHARAADLLSDLP